MDEHAAIIDDNSIVSNTYISYLNYISVQHIELPSVNKNVNYVLNTLKFKQIF